MQATADSATRHAIEEAERIKRAQTIQREAAERYQREAPQREAAERARAEKARADALRIEQACAPINVRATSPRPITSLTEAIAAIEQPTQDALLAAQQRRQQMEACNRALVLASQNR